MIDVKVTTIGVKEIAAKLGQAESGVRSVLRAELAEIGDEIVARAQAAAPRATGVMASRIAWYFGREFMRGRKGQRRQTVVENPKDPRIFFTVRPRGRVAHLVERGVSATFTQRPGRRGRHRLPQAPAVGPSLGEFSGPSYRYTRSLRIAPHPFFMPAVESVGGAAGVNARLQGALDRLANGLSRAP